MNREKPVALLANYALYQIGWLACVLGAAWGYPWTGVVIGAVTLACHLILSRAGWAELELVIACASVGLFVDCTLLWSGVFRFEQGVLLEWLPPVWMSLLWMQFATTLRFCMGWMRGRLLAGACFGLVGAPLAFFVGERLGAVEFLEPRGLSYLMLGAIWAFAIPAILRIEDWLSAETDPKGYWLFKPDLTRRRGDAEK